MKQLGVVFVTAAVCVVPAAGQTPAQRQRTVSYLQKLQAADRGFQASASGRSAALSSLRATTAAMRALHHFGGQPRDAKACAAFVKRCFDSDHGAFADLPGGKPDAITTAVGMMAVAELKLPPEPYADKVVRYLGGHARGFEEIRMAAAGVEAAGKQPDEARDWLEQLGKLRNAAGDFGNGESAARDTGGAIVAVMRLGGRVGPREQVLKTLRAGQHGDGGFGKAGAGSDLETTYRVMRAFMMLKEKPDNPGRCRAFVGKCRNADGGYSVAPGQASSAAGTYFASQVLHWLDAE